VPRSERSPLLLAGLLAAAGVAHFAAPRQFDATIPAPRTRAAAAKAAAAFFVGVFPANVQMAVDWRHRPAPQRTAALARLPLQVPLVLWARGVARNGEGRS
jgi:uncharacterized membrane protein